GRPDARLCPRASAAHRGDQRQRRHAGPAPRTLAAISCLVERDSRVRARRACRAGGRGRRRIDVGFQLSRRGPGMAIVDDRGRVAGRVNLIDALAAVFILVLIPLVYGAYLLFRTPAAKLVRVSPATVYQGTQTRL